MRIQNFELVLLKSNLLIVNSIYCWTKSQFIGHFTISYDLWLVCFLPVAIIMELAFGFANKQDIFVWIWIPPVTILVKELHIQAEPRVDLRLFSVPGTWFYCLRRDTKRDNNTSLHCIGTCFYDWNLGDYGFSKLWDYSLLVKLKLHSDKLLKRAWVTDKHRLYFAPDRVTLPLRKGDKSDSNEV